MIPLFGMVISAISFTIFAAWYFWPIQSRVEVSPSLPAASIASAPSPTLPIGSIAFIQLVAEIGNFRDRSRVTVGLRAELENTTDVLLRYHIDRLLGDANGKTIPNPNKPPMNSVEGFIYPHKRAYLLYPILTNVDASNYVVTGSLEYDISYSTEPTSIKRRSSRRIDFTKNLDNSVSATSPRATIPMIVANSKEIEQ